MAETIASAVVGIGADLSALSNALAGIPTMLGSVQTKVNEESASWLNTINNTFQSWGPKLTSVGTLISGAITVPLVGAAGAVVAMGMDFEREMSRVQALSSAPREEMEKLKDTANSLAIAFPQTATDIAKAMGDVAAAGYSVNDIIGLMPGVLALATSEQVSMATATDAVTTALNLFKVPASQATEVADLYARATADSRVNLTNLAASMEYAGPIAANLNIPMKDVVAAMMAMAENGVEATKSGTAFRQFINDLINPTKAAQEALATMNVQVRDAEGNLRPLPDLVKAFYEAQQNAKSETEFLSAAFQIWGQRTSDVMGLISGGDGTLDKFRGALDASKGSAKQMSDIIQDNLKGSLDKFHSAAGALANSLYDNFSPAVKSAVDWATGLIEKMVGLANAFKGSPEWVQLAVLALGGLAAAIGPVMVSVGLFMQGWTALAPAVITAATAISTFVTATLVPFVTTHATAAITAIGGIGGALTLIEGAVAIAAAAFAGWQLGSWLYANIPLVREFGDAVANMVPQTIFDRIAGLGGSLDNLDYATKKLESSLAAKGITVARTGLTVEEYSAKLRTAAAELTSSTTKTDGAGTATEGWRAKLEALKTQHDAAMASIAAGAAATDKHASSTASAGVEARRFTVDLEALTAKLREAEYAAEQAQLDKAFEQLNAAILNTPTALGAIPPIIGDLQADMIAKMEAAGIATEEAFVGDEGAFPAIKRRARTAWDDMIDDLAGAWDGFARNMSGGIMASLMGESDESIWSVIKSSFMTLLADMGEAVLNWAVKSLTKPIKDSLLSAFSSFGEGGGGLFGGIFGGGGGTGNTGGTGSVPGTGGGGGFSGGGDPITAMIMGTIAALGSIIGAAMMGADLGNIEENTRGTKDQLVEGLQPRINEYLPYLDNLVHVRHLESINSEIIYSKDNLWAYLPAIAEGIAAMSGVSIDGVAGGGEDGKAPLAIDPAVFEGIEQHLAQVNTTLTDIYYETIRGVELQEIALQSGGAGGSTITGDMLVGGGGIGTLNVTVNAETTSSADEIAGMVLEQILVYVPTGGA